MKRVTGLLLSALLATSAHAQVLTGAATPSPQTGIGAWMRANGPTLSPSANTTALTESGYNLTGSNSQNLFDLSGTWNTSGTPTAFKLRITNTASNAASLLMDMGTTASSLSLDTTGSLWIGNEFRVGGSRASPNVMASDQLYLKNSNDRGVYWSVTVGSSPNLLWLGFDAANTLAQRNGVNAQIFNVYNTYTDTSNYERVETGWASNSAFVRTTKAGTGTFRNLALYASGVLQFGSGGAVQWSIDSSGNFIAQSDNSSDIGASGASRPRIAYIGTRVVAPTVTTTSTTVSGLPAAATAGAGARAFVTDGSTTVILGLGTTVTGGGANKVPVYSDGTNWIVG